MDDTIILKTYEKLARYSSKELKQQDKKQRLKISKSELKKLNQLCNKIS